MRISPLRILPPVIFLSVAVLFMLGMQRENPDALPSNFQGKPAPALQVTEFDGGPSLTDADLRAPGVKLVNYWASWCAPCRVEHPVLMGLQAEGVAIHGINYKDKPANAVRFLAELGDPYTLRATDADGRSGIDWGVYGVPETFVIDGEGKVVLRFAGPVTPRVLESTIRPAIAEALAAGGS